MSLVEAKCTNCGASLQIENSQEKAFCKHCGSVYIIEKAVNNFNAEKMTNEIKDSVVNIYAGDYASLADLLKKGDAFLTVCDYNSGMAIFNRIVADFPGDWYGWWGRVLCATEGGQKYQSSSSVPFYFKSAIKLAKGKDQLDCTNWYNNYCREIAGQLAQGEVLNIKSAQVDRLIDLDAAQTSVYEAKNDLLEKAVGTLGKIVGSAMLLLGVCAAAYKLLFFNSAGEVLGKSLQAPSWIFITILVFFGLVFSSHGSKKLTFRQLFIRLTASQKSLEAKKSQLDKDNLIISGDRSEIEELVYQKLLAEVQ